MESSNRLVNASIILVGISLAFYILSAFESFLRPFIIAVILTFLLVPVTRWSKSKKTIMVLSTIGTIAILTIALTVGGAMFSERVQQENQDLKQTQNMVTAQVSDFFKGATISVEGYNVALADFISPQQVASFANSILPKIINTTIQFYIFVAHSSPKVHVSISFPVNFACFLKIFFLNFNSFDQETS